MVYFYSRKVTSVKYNKAQEEWGWDELVIEMDFTECGQCDGHVPKHGDVNLDFAEVVVRNIDSEPIIEVLKQNGVKGIKRLGRYRIEVTQLKVLDPDVFMPKLHMKLTFDILPEDEYKMLVRQLLFSVKGVDAKKAIFEKNGEEVCGLPDGESIYFI